jgi:protoheme IX farnesyltransferase
LVALHLGLALMVQAATVIAAVLAFQSPKPAVNLSNSTSRVISRIIFRSPFARLSLLSLGATLALLVSGAWVAASQVSSTCASWPFCPGGIIPADPPGWINLLHRAITGIAGILLGWLWLKSWRTQRQNTAIMVSTTIPAILFVSQALLGARQIAEGSPSYLLGLHVATAAAVWAAQIVQVTIVLIARIRQAGSETKAADSEAIKAAARSPLRLAKDFLMLTKPVVVALLLVTTFAGMVVGGQAMPPFSLVFWTLLCGALAAGGSGAINQYIDRFDDIKMQRTSNRPIPAGRLTPGEGLAFGVLIAIASFYLMVAFVNFLAALLALAGIIYYVLIYSILLKKATVQNIVIGGGAGAIPPLVGWAAATGSLNIPSLFLFAVIFMWTPPHFWALALVRMKDYARAGVPMMPVVRGEQATRWQIFIYTLELVVLTLVLPLFGLGGGIYIVSAAVLGGALLYSAWRVYRLEGNKVAWQMYRHSSMYLAFLFLALMIDALL